MLMLKANVNTFPLDGMHLALHYYTNREEFTQNETRRFHRLWGYISMCIFMTWYIQSYQSSFQTNSTSYEGDSNVS